MAIKKRAKVDPARLEEFAAGADAPSADAVVVVQEERSDATFPEFQSSAGRSGGRASSKEWPDGLAKTLLIRWADPELAQTLALVAAAVDRSQHKTALMAMERGLQVLWNETQPDR